jgi:hypothetical protein
MANVTIPSFTSAASTDAVNDYFLGYNAAATAYRKYNRNTLLGITGAPVGTTDVQTVSAKVLTNTNTYIAKSTNFTLQDVTDTTKQAQFSLSGLTTGTTRTYTLPNANVTLASLSGVETFTNKTLTSPTISGGTISNASITVDSIAGFTTSTVVSVAGVQLNNGQIGTAGAVVTNSIADAAVTPAKLIAGTGTGWTLQTYTPTWTNLTTGNGTNSAFYIQVGKIVYVNGRFTLGTTSAVGSNPFFSLPVTPSSHYNATNYQNYIGSGVAALGAVNFDMKISINPTSGASAAQIIFLNHVTNATYDTWSGASSTVPATWANLDTMHYFLVYEAA